jgi:hypothetical protein
MVSEMRLEGKGGCMVLYLKKLDGCGVMGLS